MIEESVIEELEQRGYTVRKVVKSTLECTKLVVDDQNLRYFVKCYSLKEIFRTSAEKKFVNNELNMAENFKKWDLNSCVQFIKRMYTKNTLFLFFMFHRHITLESLLQNRTLTEGQIVLVMRDLLAIVYELRGAGVLHRHLSPDKILVTGNQLKFCAFKYCTDVRKAKYDTDEYLYLIRNRTNLYCIAPEVLHNEFTGFKTQIFSFGVIVYLMTHQHYPFASETTLEHLKNLYSSNLEKAKINQNLTEPLYYLLQNCLQIAYNDRMSLSDVKVAAGGLYRQIVHEEEAIRQKLYNTLQPAIKIEEQIPSRKALKEELYGFKKNRRAGGILPRLIKNSMHNLHTVLRKNDEFLLAPQERFEGANDSVVSSHKRLEPTHLELLMHRSQKLQVRPVSLGLYSKSARNNSVLLSHNGSNLSVKELA